MNLSEFKEIVKCLICHHKLNLPPKYASTQYERHCSCQMSNVIDEFDFFISMPNKFSAHIILPTQYLKLARFRLNDASGNILQINHIPNIFSCNSDDELIDKLNSLILFS